MLSNLRAKGTRPQIAFCCTRQGRLRPACAQFLGRLATAAAIALITSDDRVFRRGLPCLHSAQSRLVAAFIVASPIVASVHTAGLSQPAGKLSITVSGACNSDGVVRCALFNSPAAFPKIGQEWRGVIAQSAVVRRLSAQCTICGPVTNATLEHDVDWFGTARARIGYAADGWLAYATGGYAFGRVALKGTATGGRRERLAHPERDAERLDDWARQRSCARSELARISLCGFGHRQLYYCGQRRAVADRQRSHPDERGARRRQLSLLAAHHAPMPLVSITRLRVRSLRYLPAFLLGLAALGREAKNATGNLAVSVLSDSQLAFWTRTLWTDERSMRGFMFLPAHRAVMPKLLQWCDEAAVTYWLQETLEPPSWQEVHRRLQQQGRTSKVDHPSAGNNASKSRRQKRRGS